jgi:hypothetical protein
MVGPGDSATWPQYRINQHFDPRELDAPQDDEPVADDDDDDEGDET